eukprot:GFYU01002713.1.p1 GENE.GFYU01002713.1~~GFYU01002713.1.p1  ORF type:complete len:100 (-),score=22.57 GFYU01002713.1:230-529(-)
MGRKDLSNIPHNDYRKKLGSFENKSGKKTRGSIVESAQRKDEPMQGLKEGVLLLALFCLMLIFIYLIFQPEMVPDAVTAPGSAPSGLQGGPQATRSAGL